MEKRTDMRAEALDTLIILKEIKSFNRHSLFTLNLYFIDFKKSLSCLYINSIGNADGEADRYEGRGS